MKRQLTHCQRQNMKDRAAVRRRARAAEIAKLSPEEIDNRIVDAILEAMEANGTVSMADVLRANVTRDAVSRRFNACLLKAEEREPRLRHMVRTDA